MNEPTVQRPPWAFYQGECRYESDAVVVWDRAALMGMPGGYQGIDAEIRDSLSAFSRRRCVSNRSPTLNEVISLVARCVRE